MADINHEELCRLLSYEPETGLFTWLIKQGPRSPVGRIAGHLNEEGYIRIRVAKQNFLAHRLAWFYVHKKWPERMLDHRNEDKTDNRIANLREASKSQNLQNKSAPNKGNKSGIRGVTATKFGTWLARISVDKKEICLGTFKTIEEAQAAYLAAKKRLHPFYGEAKHGA